MHRSVAVAGYHTAGAPFRIVVSGGPQLEGNDMSERRANAARYADELRRLIVAEPRGHEAMNGCFVTQSGSADLGAVFFDRTGFIALCGHGTIALATWAIEAGIIAGSDGRLSIDTAAGRIEVTATVEDGRVRNVSYVGVPSYVAARYLPVQLASGVVPMDVAYGGAYFAIVSVAELDLAISMANLGRLRALGIETAGILYDNPAVEHPTDARLSGLAGTIFYEERATSGSDAQQRSVTVFADGTIDRSPCGTGTSARLALLDSAALLERGRTLVNENLLGASFRGRVVGDASIGGMYGVETEITGRAFRTGTATLVQEENDPLGPGFELVQ